MTKTVWVKARSKREINSRLEAGGEKIIGTHYGFLQGGMDMNIYHLNDGDVVKIYQTTTPTGEPIGKFAGIWNAARKRLK
jgi:hypothetical protein